MYIAANLPAMYGAFQTIRDGNYPFNRQFTKYIETIIQIGLEGDLDIEDLIGFIEDNLMAEDERLPDIPKGNLVVSFRYSTSNETIQKYYRQQNINNKDITLLIIQMTLRLSVKFGTSLPRLRNQLVNMDAVRYVPETKPKIKHVPRKPAPVAATPTVDVSAVVPVETAPPEKSDADDKDAMLTRLERLAKKGASALGEEQTDDDTVVATNPALGDFFDL